MSNANNLTEDVDILMSAYTLEQWGFDGNFPEFYSKDITIEISNELQLARKIFINTFK